MHDAARLLQDVQEHEPRQGIAAKARVDAAARAIQRAQRGRGHAAQLLVLHQQQEAFENRKRLLVEQVFAHDFQPLAPDAKALVERSRRDVGLGRKALLQVLQNDGVELRHALRRLVVALHHRFACAPVRAVAIAELRGERGLHVEHQAVLAAAGEVVEPNAHVLQQRFALRELPRFIPLDQALRDQVAPAPAEARGERDPLDHLQVAQAAGSFLEVRLQRVGRVLVLGVALLLLEFLCLEERRRV